MNQQRKAMAVRATCAPARRHGASGFTLIEMSIVLVVIGLIVGGVLAGQDLIKAAQTRKIISELQQIDAAVNTFKGKYDCLPGDCSNASQWWGLSATSCADGSTVPLAAGGPTCNGDGNGEITQRNVPGLGYGSGFEIYWFWQHLANAGLYPLGGMSQMGLCCQTGYTPWGSELDIGMPGMNIPMSNTGLGGWYEDYYGPGVAGGSNWWNTYFMGTWPDGNVLIFDGGPDNANQPVNKPVLPAVQAQSIDSKIDDGQPTTGKIIAGVYGNCTAGGAYNLKNVGGLATCLFLYDAGW